MLTMKKVYGFSIVVIAPTIFSDIKESKAADKFGGDCCAGYENEVCNHPSAMMYDNQRWIANGCH